MRSPVLPNPRPAVEAFPRFNILNLDKAFRRGRTVLGWFDEYGMLKGYADFDLGAYTLDLSYRFERSPYIGRAGAEARLQIDWSSHADISTRPSIVCECGHRRLVIIYCEGRWACRKCHRLHHVSTRIDSDTRSYLRYKDLSTIATRPRPRHMRHARYEKIKQEYDILTRRWSGVVARSMSDDASRRMNERYFTIGDAPEWRTLDVPFPSSEFDRSSQR